RGWHGWSRRYGTILIVIRDRIANRLTVWIVRRRRWSRRILPIRPVGTRICVRRRRIVWIGIVGIRILSRPRRRSTISRTLIIIRVGRILPVGIIIRIRRVLAHNSHLLKQVLIDEFALLEHGTSIAYVPLEKKHCISQSFY